jgi:hypothetical protein
MKAAIPPAFCALATACRATVVLPLLSGPYISTTRPRGRPPMPSATSSAIDPVGITSIGRANVVAQAHHGTLAVLLLDLAHHRREGLVLVLVLHRGHHTHRSFSSRVGRP